jgi:hypothetical protein
MSEKFSKNILEAMMGQDDRHQGDLDQRAEYHRVREVRLMLT